MRCTKCGGEYIRRRYHRDESCKGLGRRPGTGKEHLHLNCETCGYDWTEPTANAPQAATA